MTISNKVYTTLKWIVTIALPAFGSLYFGLAQIWGFPNADKVVGTCSIVATFIGILIGVSSANYKGEGTLKVDESNDEKDIYRLDLDIPLEDIKKMSAITLKVDPNAKLED